MDSNSTIFARTARLALLLITLLPGCWMAAQVAPSRATATTTNEDREVLRQRLFDLLRLSPRLTSVLSRDPSLLGDQEYVARLNPELGQYLQQHPEIVRNPEFYLFADSRQPGRRLEQYVWPDSERHPAAWERYMGGIAGFLVFLVLLCALLWLIRVLLENRRWNKILRLQSEVHGKLLDKFGNNQELLAYMNTDAGKRFLEAAPLPAGPELAASTKVSLARILLPLQAGVVLTLLGTGLFLLRDNPQLDAQGPLLALGTIGITLGIGFIISAVVAFFVARHFDLLPKRPDTPTSKVPL